MAHGVLGLGAAPAQADPPPGYCVGVNTPPVLINGAWVCTP